MNAQNAMRSQTRHTGQRNAQIRNRELLKQLLRLENHRIDAVKELIVDRLQQVAAAYLAARAGSPVAAQNNQEGGMHGRRQADKPRGKLVEGISSNAHLTICHLKK